MFKVRNAEEILEDVKSQNDIPKDYELLEIYCFLCLKKIILMYQNNQLSKEIAQKQKQLVFAKYTGKKKEYEFQQGLFKKYIDKIQPTENLRIQLRKKLQEKTPITEERMGELLSICLELIQIYSGEVFE
ncbi:MAG: hypothetical protein E7314_05845 [Clostridiales bacterium]|nr:hypothetical protein [Clostridiales bacterium]